MRLCFWLCWFVCLQGYLQSNEYICMKFLPGVCLRPETNPSNFGDDPEYDLDYNADHTAEVCSLRLSVLFSLFSMYVIFNVFKIYH